jgi:peptidoglycan/LPS O-acetylase OafA/YrhL
MALTTYPTVGEIMDRHRGGPGFDWLRIGLSLGVIVLHSFHTAYGQNAPRSELLAVDWTSPIWAAILPAFFCASGFMVTGSALRTQDVKVFLWFRSLRIVPALFVEVSLSALILGSWLTTLPLSEYFSRTETWSYFGNIVGWIHYELPGVFETNPYTGIVNKSLWTLHPEFACYAAMAGLMITGLVYRTRSTAAIWLAATIYLIVEQVVFGRVLLDGVFGSRVLVYSFISGMLLYHLRHRIPVSGLFALVATAIGYGLLKTEFYLAALPFVFYLMLWIGMTRFPRIGFLQNGDYSYGLYLYGYPIQQMVVLFLPAQWREWWVVFLLAVPLALIVSMVSWNFVEKPTLRLKNVVKKRPPPIASTTEPPLVDPEVMGAKAHDAEQAAARHGPAAAAPAP